MTTGRSLVLRCSTLAAAWLSACGGSDAPRPTPTFSDDVAPLVARHCASCHTPGRIAPFPLLTYDDVRDKALAVKAATASRTMPPYNADNSGDCGTYADARWLTDDEIATIAAWVDGGAPAGDRSRAAPPVVEPPRLESPTHAVDMGETYTPHGDGTDDYRCFIVDPGTTTDGFLSAYEVLPGETRVVHHVLLYGMRSAEAEAKAHALDDADPGPGYGCFGGPNLGAGGFNYLAAWAPGTGATFYPAGTGIRVTGGRKAIMQVHYNVAAGELPDRTTIALRLEPTVERIAKVMPLYDLSLSLPPHLDEVSAGSDRLIGDEPQRRVLGVYPHMHLLGKTLQVDHVRGGAPRCVTRVPRWNFHWQQFFFFDQPFDLSSGDTLRITCKYDTRSASEVVTWGEGTADEMCVAGLYVTE